MAEKPVITIPEGEPPAELLIDDEIVGEGEEAIIGKRVIVHYVGVAWSNGQEFDASWNRGDTFDFRLGAREVIEGWDRGVKGMKAVSYTHLRAHETVLDLVCRLLLEKKNNKNANYITQS